MNTIEDQTMFPTGTGSNDNMAQKHSTLGVVSFVISMAVGVLIFALFVVAGILDASRGGEAGPYPGQMLVGFAVIFLMAADVVGIGLGIAGLCQRGKKRLFAILGVVFSSATVLGTVVLMFIGLIYASRFAH